MARFVITAPSNQTRAFEISSWTVNMGCVATNHRVLPHPSVARHRAHLNILPGDNLVPGDLGSTNGTFVDGRQVHEQRFVNQDRISLDNARSHEELVRRVLERKVLERFRSSAPPAGDWKRQEGRDFGRRHALSVSADITRNSIDPGVEPVRQEHEP
jgi:pSer/pThr/pTyr-binding forkhead associated (FHA) protein